MYHDFKTNLAKVKGLGSLKGGAHHWWHQRLTSIIMILLMGWLLCFIKCLAKSEVTTIISLLQKPYNVVPAVIFTLTAFYHAVLGMQVVIEDYFKCLWTRGALIVTVKIFSLITVVAFIFALLSMMNI